MCSIKIHTNNDPIAYGAHTFKFPPLSGKKRIEERKFLIAILIGN